MEICLDIYNLPKLNEKDNIASKSMCNKTKVVTKDFPSRKSLGLSVTTEFYKILEIELTVILMKLSQNTEQDRTLLNSLYESSIKQDTTQKANYVLDNRR